MRYEVQIGINKDEHLPWSKNVVVEADDELTAGFRAGLEVGQYKVWGYDLEVLAIRSEEPSLEPEPDDYNHDQS